MIIGNGIDIVEKSRINRVMDNYGQRFVNKILSQTELKQYQDVSDKKSFIAKRFAAKEAFVKALGTGFTRGLTFCDITITNDQSGKPSVEINDKILSLLSDHPDISCHLSISDERHYACAFVILERC